MAEVLPPLQSPSTITMLHPRPASADAFQSSSQHHQQQSNRNNQTPRAVYNGHHPTHRPTASAPVQPYAFQSTPHLRQETRAISAPSSPHGVTGLRHGHMPSNSTSSSDASSAPSAKDDSVMGSRPGSLINLAPAQLPDLNFTPFDAPVKTTPDRYRRPAQKKPEAVAPAFSSADAAQDLDNRASTQSYAHRRGSVDDMAVRSSTFDSAKRYRRRSLNGLDTKSLAMPHSGPGVQQPTASGATSTPTTMRPVSFRSNSGNSEESESTSRHGSDLHSKEATRAQSEAKQGPVNKNIAIPPRGSSDANKRTLAPSPLSKQAVDTDSPSASAAASPTKPKTYAAVAQAAVVTPSPAAQQLAAVSDKDLNKGMKSRLRRAFSFGSAQELRRAAGENSSAAQQAKEQHQQRLDDELDAEQQEIARRQEEAGIGAGIYSGQGGFSGSTDNLSISSTASSASMMLRKMGRGAKKSARSIKGLFRPKSVVGVPAADGPVQVKTGATVQPSVGQVSMVTVEAERQKVNVNAEASEKSGGGTGFPKLERNSIDTANGLAPPPDARGSADGSDSMSRRSIVGSDRDRAQVLAAVKKGILKRTGTASPLASPDIRPADAAHAAAAQFTDSPAPSLPSTPKDGQTGRPNDYFSPRMASATKSMPSTPNGSVRGITFSPRIQFHDAWSASDYDRRGDIATCNRLTPMLAQQIKEELNTFKMEMEVHEQSKPHTHFF